MSKRNKSKSKREKVDHKTLSDLFKLKKELARANADLSEQLDARLTAMYGITHKDATYAKAIQVLEHGRGNLDFNEFEATMTYHKNKN